MCVRQLVAACTAVFAAFAHVTGSRRSSQDAIIAQLSTHTFPTMLTTFHTPAAQDPLQPACNPGSCFPPTHSTHTMFSTSIPYIPAVAAPDAASCVCAAQLGYRFAHILRRLMPIAMHLLQKEGQFPTGHDLFLKRVGASYGAFLESAEKGCKARCQEDLLSTTRYVTWSLHTKSRSSLQAMLGKVSMLYHAWKEQVCQHFFLLFCGPKGIGLCKTVGGDLRKYLVVLEMQTDEFHRSLLLLKQVQLSALCSVFRLVPVPRLLCSAWQIQL